MATRRKRQPYRYRINGVVVTSWKKIYVVNGTPCHKTVMGYEPVSPALHTKIMMARLGE